MELEVGTYVRTKNNGICKLYREFHEDSVDVGIGVFPEIDGFFIDKEEINYIEKDDILKSNKNIIDLIEVGDYVNGYEVIGFDATYFNGVDRREEPKRLSVIVDRDKFMGFAQTHFKNEDIKTILTKEVFKANEYRVETD